MLLAIDPGLRGVGAALFEGSTLYRAFYVPGAKEGTGPAAWVALTSNLANMCGEVDELVIEFPQCYPRASSKVNNDLMQLAAVDGAIARAFWTSRVTDRDEVAVRAYSPAQWKGQVPKDVHHGRILKALSDEEQARIEWPRARKTLGHNVLDAVGLGLFHVGRTKRAGRGKVSS